MAFKEAHSESYSVSSRLICCIQLAFTFLINDVLVAKILENNVYFLIAIFLHVNQLQFLY